MANPSPSPSKIALPLSRAAVIDAYFIEHRGKLLDLAAFLDRVDRAGTPARAEDFRLDAFRRAVALLTDGKPERSRRILELLSDPSLEPIPAAGVKGAIGAYPSAPGSAAAKGGPV
jgi:hypothetical protein